MIHLRQRRVAKAWRTWIAIQKETEAKELRQDYEAAERELHGDTDRLALLKAYPNRLLPSFDAATRNRTLVTAAQEILGENILVWSAALFIKEADSTKIVSWHQDLTYWQLNDIKEVTCWLAVSSARKEAGSMKFIPGSHKDKIVPNNHKPSISLINFCTISAS